MLVHSIDDCNKLVLQCGASDKEPIDIRLIDQLGAVAIAHRPSVDDPGRAGNLLVNLLGQPLPDLVVHLLSLRSRGRQSCTDGPNWLVGNGNVCPVSGGQNVVDRAELLADDLEGLPGLAVRELLANAGDDLHL